MHFVFICQRREEALVHEESYIVCAWSTTHRDVVEACPLLAKEH